MKLESPATLPELKNEIRKPFLEDCSDTPDEWGPIHGEDEDLRIALQDSLKWNRNATDDKAMIGGARVQSSRDKWGPIHSEDEDLMIALQNSLKLDKNGKAGATNNHTSGATLAMGYEGRYRFSRLSEHELAGLENDRTTPPQGSTTVASEHSFSHQPQTHNTRPEEQTALPPQLQQLLDSSERLGTNV